MRWSQYFIPTLREDPADAEVISHKLLLRAGIVRQLSAGIYSYLFMGQRSFNKIMAIVREEMDTIGQEFYLPALNPREIWEASGRWSVMGRAALSRHPKVLWASTSVGSGPHGAPTSSHHEEKFRL